MLLHGERDLSVVSGVGYSGGMAIVWIRLAFVLGCCSLGFAGCAAHVVVPESFEAQLDTDLTFAQILAAPESHVGKRIVVGGEVLKTTRTGAEIQVEMLQLPLTADYEPSWVRTESQGRLLAVQPEGLELAALREGMTVTLVGEVTGARMGRLDEVEYRYPMFSVKHLYVWPSADVMSQRPGFPLGVYGGVGGGGRIGGGFGRGF